MEIHCSHNVKPLSSLLVDKTWRTLEHIIRVCGMLWFGSRDRLFHLRSCLSSDFLLSLKKIVSIQVCEHSPCGCQAIVGPVILQLVTSGSDAPSALIWLHLCISGASFINI
jgi:hypothetical protein